MDKIIINGLNVEAIVGLYSWERSARQKLLINIELKAHTQTAAASQDLKDTIDYAEVCACVEKWIIDGKFELLETLAETVATNIQKQFNVEWLSLGVFKQDVLTHVERVGIEIERGNR